MGNATLISAPTARTLICKNQLQVAFSTIRMPIS